LERRCGDLSPSHATNTAFPVRQLRDFFLIRYNCQIVTTWSPNAWEQKKKKSRADTEARRRLYCKPVTNGRKTGGDGRASKIKQTWQE